MSNEDLSDLNVEENGEALRSLYEELLDNKKALIKNKYQGKVVDEEVKDEICKSMQFTKIVKDKEIPDTSQVKMSAIKRLSKEKLIEDGEAKASANNILDTADFYDVAKEEFEGSNGRLNTSILDKLGHVETTKVDINKKRKEIFKDPAYANLSKEELEAVIELIDGMAVKLDADADEKYRKDNGKPAKKPKKGVDYTRLKKIAEEIGVKYS